jgi:hypothetical protein
MSTNYTFQISEEECIGDSLATINLNYSNLDTAVTTLSTSMFYTVFDCERSGTGTTGDYMAFGNGASSHQGTRMPYNGEIITATFQYYGVTGTITVGPMKNGISPGTIYNFTATGTGITDGEIKTYSPPIMFEAGDRIGFRQIQAPATATAYNVTFTVRFRM